ncbi:MAG: hypothetical protein LBR30_02640 [Clostridioides sp.]|nr:hypothetical protein [Clostridioides sp.]
MKTKKAKLISKIVAYSMAIISIFYTISPYAETISYQQRLDVVLRKIDVERSKTGEASAESMEELDNILSGIRVPRETRGFGQEHNLGGGWRARVDRPRHGAGQAKPHVHVYKGNVNGVENCDGTESHGHGKSLEEVGVPRKVRDKARSLPDYKKGKEEIKKMQKAKKQIRAKKLNLRNNKDLKIAIGITVAILGYLLFKLIETAAWAFVLLAI